MTGGVRVLNAVLGLLAFVVGLYAVRHVLVSVVALAVLLGIFWIINGFVEIFGATDQPRRAHHESWTGFMGLLSIAAGVVVLAYPGISLVTLALVLGIWLIIYGVMEIGLAFRVQVGPGPGAPRGSDPGLTRPALKTSPPELAGVSRPRLPGGHG